MAKAKKIRIEVVPGIASWGPTWGVLIDGHELCRCWTEAAARSVANAVRSGVRR